MHTIFYPMTAEDVAIANRASAFTRSCNLHNDRADAVLMSEMDMAGEIFSPAHRIGILECRIDMQLEADGL